MLSSLAHLGMPVTVSARKRPSAMSPFRRPSCKDEHLPFSTDTIVSTCPTMKSYQQRGCPALLACGGRAQLLFSGEVIPTGTGEPVQARTTTSSQ